MSSVSTLSQCSGLTLLQLNNIFTPKGIQNVGKMLYSLSYGIDPEPSSITNYGGINSTTKEKQRAVVGWVSWVVVLQRNDWILVWDTYGKKYQGTIPNKFGRWSVEKHNTWSGDPLSKFKSIVWENSPSR